MSTCTLCACHIGDCLSLICLIVVARCLTGSQNTFSRICMQWQQNSSLWLQRWRRYDYVIVIVISVCCYLRLTIFSFCRVDLMKTVVGALQYKQREERYSKVLEDLNNRLKTVSVGCVCENHCVCFVMWENTIDTLLSEQFVYYLMQKIKI